MIQRTLRTFALLRREPRFARYWSAQVLSLLGDQITIIALSWFVLQTTGSGLATAGILLALELPAILTGLIAGALLDRIQPRILILVDNATRMALVALVPLLFLLRDLNLEALFVIAIGAGALQPITRVGSMALLPRLVPSESLDEANALWSFGTNLAMILGPGIAGLLVAALGGPLAMLVDASTFALMAAVAYRFRSCAGGRPGDRRASQSGSASGSFGPSRRSAWPRCSASSSSLPMVPWRQPCRCSAFTSWGLTPAGTGCCGRHSASAPCWARWQAPGLPDVPPGLVLPLIALGWGASLLPLVWAHQLWTACVWLGLGGLLWGPYTPMEMTLLQRTVPSEELGRVFGARSTLLTSGSPLGLAVGGALLAFLPSTALILLSAGSCMLVGLAALLSPGLRRLQGAP